MERERGKGRRRERQREAECLQFLLQCQLYIDIYTDICIMQLNLEQGARANWTLVTLVSAQLLATVLWALQSAQPYNGISKVITKEQCEERRVKINA